MAEIYTVQLPDGRTIEKELPDGATDGQIRKAFAKDMHDAGVNVMRQKIQRPSNEDHWREKLGDQGEISNPDFDLGETLEGSLGDLLANALSERDARRLAKKTFNAVNDLTPIGDVVGAERGGSEFYNGLTQGDLGKMALGAGSFALSVLPGSGAVQRKGEDWLRALLGDETGAIRAYHGGFAHDGNFDLTKAGSGVGYADEPAVWFTPDFTEANRYAWSVGGGPLQGRPVSGSYYGKAVYPATIDDAGFDDFAPMDYDPEEFARIIAEARKANKPGIIFRSVREDDRLSTPADQIAVLDPSRISFGN